MTAHSFHWHQPDRPERGEHYSVLRVRDPSEGMAALRLMFPDGVADDLNMVVFSTSGVHGSFHTIEEIEAGECKKLTFLIIQPRMVTLRYGTCIPETPEDFAWLKRLRETSHAQLAQLGVR